MVRKLFKHEFVYYIRTLMIFLPWVLFTGIIARLALMVMDLVPHYLVSAATYSWIFIMIFSGMALLCFTSILSLVRFYKNMYSAEGYLTFTLPITNIQHVFVKCATSFTVSVASAITFLIALEIAFLWNPLSIIVGILELAKAIGVAHFVFYVIEIALLLAVSSISNTLLYYACISIGQLAKKNRILLAIGAFYIHNVAIQILSWIFFAILVLASATPIQFMFTWMGEHPAASVHICLVAFTLFIAGLCTLYLFITLKIMNRKLNLE